MSYLKILLMNVLIELWKVNMNLIKILCYIHDLKTKVLNEMCDNRKESDEMLKILINVDETLKQLSLQYLPELQKMIIESEIDIIDDILEEITKENNNV